VLKAKSLLNKAYSLLKNVQSRAKKIVKNHKGLFMSKDIAKPRRSSGSLILRGAYGGLFGSILGLGTIIYTRGINLTGYSFAGIIVFFPIIVLPLTIGIGTIIGLIIWRIHFRVGRNIGFLARAIIGIIFAITFWLVFFFITDFIFSNNFQMSHVFKQPYVLLSVKYGGIVGAIAGIIVGSQAEKESVACL
jgi:hypothetical protein